MRSLKENESGDVCFPHGSHVSLHPSMDKLEPNNSSPHDRGSLISLTTGC